MYVLRSKSQVHFVFTIYDLKEEKKLNRAMNVKHETEWERLHSKCLLFYIERFVYSAVMSAKRCQFYVFAISVCVCATAMAREHLS